MDYKYHPATEPYPLMEGEEFDRLVDSIKRSGQRVPAVIVDGMLFDGRNRDRACQKLGIQLITKEVKLNGLSPVAAAAEYNLVRRHLDKKGRDLIISSLREDGDSIRTIAKKVGLPKTTVQDALSGVRIRTPAATTDESVGSEPSAPVLPPTVRGADGKKYPRVAKKTRPAAEQRRRREKSRVPGDMFTDEKKLLNELIVFVKRLRRFEACKGLGDEVRREFRAVIKELSEVTQKKGKRRE